MRAEDVVDLQRALELRGLVWCVVGGWGVTDVDGATPLWTTDLVLTADELTASGRIADVDVRCMTAATQLACHAGYPLPAEHVGDVELLRALLGGTAP